MWTTFDIEGARAFYLSLYGRALGEAEALALFAAAMRDRERPPIKAPHGNPRPFLLSIAP